MGWIIYKGGVMRVGSSGSAAWRLVSDGDIIYRKGRRGGYYVIDYSSDGGATWELDIVVLGTDETSIIRTIDSSPDGYRDQVRGGSYMIDIELGGDGFDGPENTDWENIIEIKP